MMTCIKSMPANVLKWFLKSCLITKLKLNGIQQDSIKKYIFNTHTHTNQSKNTSLIYIHTHQSIKY